MIHFVVANPVIKMINVTHVFIVIPYSVWTINFQVSFLFFRPFFAFCDQIFMLTWVTIHLCCQPFDEANFSVSFQNLVNWPSAVSSHFWICLQLCKFRSSALSQNFICMRFPIRSKLQEQFRCENLSTYIDEPVNNDLEKASAQLFLPS